MSLNLGEYRPALHRRAEPDSPSRAGLHDPGLCPRSNKAEQRHGAVYLSGFCGYGEL